VLRATGPPPRRADVERGLRAEGLTPRPWSDGPDVSYGRHEHEHHKVLLCMSGSIIFHTDAGDVALAAGDRMELPRGGRAQCDGGRRRCRVRRGLPALAVAARRGCASVRPQGYRRVPMDPLSGAVVTAG